MTRKSAKHPRSSAANRGRGWGGRRPGAGAPKGNLNALKHGLRSRQIAQLGVIFAADPKLQAVLLGIAGRWQRRSLRSEEVSTQIFSQIIQRGLKRGDARRGEPRLIVLPPLVDGPSIKPVLSEAEGTATLEHRPAQTGRRKNHPSINQEPNATPRKRSRSIRENPLD